MTDNTRYGWPVLREPKTDAPILCVVDGDKSDASIVAEQNNGHTVGDRVKIVRSRGTRQH